MSVTTPFASKSSTLPESDMSSLLTTSATMQSSTSVKGTSRLYTKWYPFVETTPSTLDRNNVSLFSGNTSSESSTEVTSFLNDVSSVYSITGKGTSEVETVSSESQTFPTVPSELSSAPSTIRIETEHLTQKSFRNENTTASESNYHEEGARTLASINDTSSSETSSTMGYISNTG